MIIAARVRKRAAAQAAQGMGDKTNL